MTSDITETDKAVAEHVRAILKLIGENPDREGLLDTPMRVAKAYKEIFSGLRESNEPKVTVFKNEEEYNEMVIESGVEFSSMCEHHLLPFIGKAYVGYIPRKKGYYVGLSKIARVVDFYAKRPQVQERLTGQIADWLVDKLNPQGCIVVLEAAHSCMSMRGVKKPHHLTMTSAIRGKIDRDEFFRIINPHRTGKI